MNIIRLGAGIPDRVANVDGFLERKSASVWGSERGERRYACTATTSGRKPSCNLFSRARPVSLGRERRVARHNCRNVRARHSPVSTGEAERRMKKHFMKK